MTHRKAAPVTAVFKAAPKQLNNTRKKGRQQTTTSHQEQQQQQLHKSKQGNQQKQEDREQKTIGTGEKKKGKKSLKEGERGGTLVNRGR